MERSDADRRNTMTEPNRSVWPRLLLLGAMVAAAAFARLLPHPDNFSPVGALALFGGACFASKRIAFFLPLAALLLSDVALGFYAILPVVYGCYALNVLLGRWLRARRRFGPIALTTVAGAVQFFVITNFACWVERYPHTVEGFVACYAAALPFFRNGLAGDAVFAAVLFGGLAIAEAMAPAVREEPRLVAA